MELRITAVLPNQRENDKVTIRFRTKRDNVDMVWLCSRREKQRMKRTETKWDFDYYSVEIQLEANRFSIISKS